MERTGAAKPCFVGTSKRSDCRRDTAHPAAANQQGGPAVPAVPAGRSRRVRTLIKRWPRGSVATHPTMPATIAKSATVHTDHGMARRSATPPPANRSRIGRCRAADEEAGYPGREQAGLGPAQPDETDRDDPDGREQSDHRDRRIEAVETETGGAGGERSRGVPLGEPERERSRDLVGRHHREGDDDDPSRHQWVGGVEERIAVCMASVWRWWGRRSVPGGTDGVFACRHSRAWR